MVGQNMKVLVFGDIVGRPGRQALKQVLPQLKAELGPDLVIANAENLAHGKGVTVETLRELVDYGVDFFTSGNHVWDNKAGLNAWSEPDLRDRLIRPANYPACVGGHGSKLLTLGTKSVLVVNLLGRVFGKTLVDDPFRTFDDVLRAHAASPPSLVLVDFHADASSEKVAMGWHVAGRAAAVWGTHTHVPTADARVLPGGTAYITDVGMTGFRDGVLGITKEPILANFKTGLPAAHELPDHGEAIVSAVLIEIEGREATAITAHHRTCAF